MSNFQIRVLLDSSFTFTSAKADGSDLRVTASDGTTPIPFWIEQWNAGQASASIWVQVPSIPVSGTTVYLYYGNPAAASASSGDSTFDFFDDFNSSNLSTQGYFKLGSPQTVMVQDQAWESAPPHTLSVVAANNGGYTYWGYYGRVDCGGVGLAYSNDLVTWTKNANNPLFSNGRWPSVLLVNGTFYMLYDKDYCATPQIVLATSSDGINFTDVKTIVQPNYLNHPKNQNPHLFFNSNDGRYYLYWYSGDDATTWSIMARSATSPSGLDDTSTEVTVLSASSTLAAPNMMYSDGTYFLSTEVYDNNGLWTSKVYSSSSPVSGFTVLPGNPVLANGSACMFQHMFGTTLHNYYCKLTNNIWTIEHRSADLTAGRLQFPVANSNKWTASGGSWTLVSDTRPDGSSGLVMQASTSGNPQILYSSYKGSDYVVEGYGKQIQGNVWGVGARVSDPNDFYSFNLYDNLNTGQNLWAYRWQNSSAATLGSAAVGQVNTNTWYKLRIQVQGSAIDVYKDDLLQFHTADALLPSGGVALYGENGTVANFSQIRVRKFAAVEPTIAVGPVQVSVPLSSLTLSPTGLTGGSSSTGTATLSGPAPNNGVVVNLSSSNTGVAAVPATVTIPAGAASATFPITTQAIATLTQVSISASYGSATQTASLTVMPPVPNSLTLNPASLTGGNASVGTLTLNGPAPSGGAAVALSGSDPAATVPTIATVPAGATSTTFTVSTAGVATTTSVTVAASYGGGTQTSTLTVVPPVLSALGLSPATVTGGHSSTGTVTLNGPAPPNGAAVKLTGNNPAGTVPASVTIPAGATSAVFTISTTAVATATNVTVTASYGSGGSQTVILTVIPPVLSSMSLNPTTVTGGNPSTGTVALSGPAPSGGVTVALSSSNLLVATVPANVTIPAGSSTATFSVTTLPVLYSTSVTIAGTYKNSTQSASLGVTPVLTVGTP